MRYTVQFKDPANGARVSGVEADSAADAISKAGRDLGCRIDPLDPRDQSFLLEAIPEADAAPHANILTTADGYMYTQQPNGWFTDGDIEFDANNTDIFGLLWLCVDHYDGGVIYCADGDGFVTVQPVDDHFVVAEQGDAVSVHHTLREALMAAQAILAADYAGIYESIIQ